MLQAGDAIDRYVIVRPLGAGGMGQVYEARDPRLQRRVALKVLKREETAEDAADGVDRVIPRLLREARLAAALEHPNVVAVYDVGEVHDPEALRGTMYLAMELIPGRPLRAFVGDASVSMDERLRWLREVASALGAAHDRGLVHRDVKPENVMIRDDGVAKVLDFGVAWRTRRPVDPTASTEAAITFTSTDGVAVGTPHYMAPEQMRAEALDGRADQFSWGVMAFELLGGELPWSTTPDPLQFVAQVLSRDPPPLASKNPDVPAAVVTAVTRALSKAPEHRFPSMTALLEAMEVAASPTVPSAATERAPPAGARPAAPRVVRKRRTAFAALATLLGVAMVVAGGLLLALRRAPPSSAAAAGPPPTEPATTQTTHDEAARPAGSEPPRAAPPNPPSTATPPAVARPAGAPPPPGPASRGACDPPYYVDSAGIRQYRRECL